MRKRFLFTTLCSSDLGLITRSLPIAHELRERGHDVLFYNPAKAPRKLIADAGFQNAPSRWPLLYLIGGDASMSRFARLFLSRHAIRDVRILVSLRQRLKRFGTPDIWNLDQFYFPMLGNESYARAAVHDLISVINEHQPDAVVDFWNASACIAARATSRRLITVIQADTHPDSDGFIWWRRPPGALATPTPTVNKLLAELRLKPVRKTAELFVGDKTLVVGMPETDPLPVTAEVTYIGAVLWQNRGARLPSWVSGLDASKPLIWIYSGNPRYLSGCDSAFDSRVVISACIEAFGEENLQVVLSSGHQTLPREALPLPANFRYEPFLPGLAMAERSDLMIHHGGYGSCQTGLYVGTPALVIPTYSERESNARRVAAAGAGEFVLPWTDASQVKRVDAADVRTKARHILSEPSYKHRARSIGEKLRSYGGAPYAATLIDQCT